MNISDNFLRLTIEESKKGDHKQRTGCLIFDKKKIISIGHNTCVKSCRKLHPKFQRWPGSIHAEVDAIIKAKKELKGCDILIVRINRLNQLRYARPCVNCMKYIKHVGIHKLFYTINEYPYIQQEKI
jgi:deoxycytidylate deaminase